MPKNFYSPSMLKKYLSCKHIIFNEKNENRLKLKRKPHSNIDQLRFDKGNIHEAKYFEKLKKKYSKVKDIKKLKNVDKFKETLNAMKQGYEIIYGGWLTDGKWSGEADFLEINKKNKSNFGDYFYEVIDTKNSKKIRGDHIYQVGIYSDLLKKSQGTPSENLYILLKDGKKEKVKLNEIYDVFNSHKEKYEQFLKNEVDKTKPEKCSFCTFCSWSEECLNEWKEKRHLNQVGGINKINIKRFNKSGVKTIDQLAKLNPKTKIEGLREEVKKKRVEQAKLQIESEKINKPIFKPIKENLFIRKGFNLLPKPSKCDLFFDLESSMWAYEEKLEYLFGIYYEENGKQNYLPLWAHNQEEEKKNLIKFFDFTKDHFKKYPDAKIYHYAAYEVNALERLTSLHKIKHIEYDHYLHLNKFVDLFRVAKQAILVSENSYSIKALEKFYKFERSGDVKKGEQSEEFYIEWIETKKQKLLDEIEFYNKEDCHSTFKLREWLLDIKPEGTSWFIPDKEEMETRTFEEKIIEYRNKLEDSKFKNNYIPKLMLDIVGFYNREQKPEWREHFDRRDFSDEDLIEDKNCIGNMKLVSSHPEKKSIVYTYVFSDQEYKFKKNDRVVIANNINSDKIKDYAGTIIFLDQINKKIKLKKQTTIDSPELPNKLSIANQIMGSNTFINLNNNIYRFIDNILENKKNYQALIGFLNREFPLIDGIKKGDKIIKTNDFNSEIPNVISKLKNSWIYLQGTPGTGKTSMSAVTILELIKKRKKIAITANSHSVIHNLLDKVESLAVKKKISFKGIKGGKPDKEDPSYYNGKYILTKEVGKKYERNWIESLNDNSTFVFAGTKFLLSWPFFYNKLDYLLIDEAGQISLADLIALGGIAKNIILVGDQMQLGQPIQGNHPGQSGQSILDYLLGDQDTIAPEKGIFLDRTFRLHPKINSFISESFYDGRLLTDEITSQRQIDFSSNGLIKSEGIHFIAMDHQERSQTCLEEYKVIDKLMKQLVGSKFTYNGKTRKLDLSDFLIISPYNAQVNYLLSRLEKGTKCGTIDKFQGQEAPITIISMTSSDTENLPRHKSFFFNRNRLNVAISRAQSASIILFNPRLLDTAPADYEEMKMLNNFYKLLDYKI